jgi:hypothetical protein
MITRAKSEERRAKSEERMKSQEPSIIMNENARRDGRRLNTTTAILTKDERAWNVAIARWWSTVTHNPLLNGGNIDTRRTY